MKIHFSFTKFVNYLAIAFCALPLFSNLISIYLGGILYMLIAYSIALLTMLVNTRRVSSKDMYFMFGFVAFFIFITLYMIGTQVFVSHYRTTSFAIFDLSTPFYNFIASLPAYVSCFFVFFKSNEKPRKNYFTFYSLCFFYTTLVTFVALIFVPDYAKNETASVMTDKMRIFSLIGASGFNLIYSLSFLLPLFFCIFRKTKRLYLLLLFILGTLTVILSGFLIATFILIINYILSLLLSIRRTGLRRFVIIIFIGIVVFFLFNIRLIGEIALNISEYVTIGEIKRRLIQLSNSILYNDFSGDAVSGRMDAYLKSLSGIANHPFVGNLLLVDTFTESGHSTILDSWASFGIILPIIFLLGTRMFYLASIKGECKKTTRNAICVSIFCFILVSLLNPVLATPTIFLNFMLTLGFSSYLNKNSEELLVYRYLKLVTC